MWSVTSAFIDVRCGSKSSEALGLSPTFTQTELITALLRLNTRGNSELSGLNRHVLTQFPWLWVSPAAGLCRLGSTGFVLKTLQQIKEHVAVFQSLHLQPRSATPRHQAASEAAGVAPAQLCFHVQLYWRRSSSSCKMWTLNSCHFARL